MYLHVYFARETDVRGVSEYSRGKTYFDMERNRESKFRKNYISVKPIEIEILYILVLKLKEEHRI